MLVDFLTATWYEFETADYTVWESGTSVTVTVIRRGDVTASGSVGK